jgi:ferredoxin like protein
LIFSYEGCLECGTCKMVCSLQAVNWSYPKQGNGVLYRFG